MYEAKTSNHVYISMLLALPFTLECRDMCSCYSTRSNVFESSLCLVLVDQINSNTNALSLNHVIVFVSNTKHETMYTPGMG